VNELITARYEGYCPKCKDEIDVGDKIGYTDTFAVCEECFTSRDRSQRRENTTVCPECFLIHSGECL